MERNRERGRQRKGEGKKERIEVRRDLATTRFEGKYALMSEENPKRRSSPRPLAWQSDGWLTWAVDTQYHESIL